MITKIRFKIGGQLGYDIIKKLNKNSAKITCNECNKKILYYAYDWYKRRNQKEDTICLNCAHKYMYMGNGKVDYVFSKSDVKKFKKDYLKYLMLNEL